MAKYVDANGLVYKSLVERISDGSLAPGTKLREEAIAEELGTSRTPVREALRTLAAEGLVEIAQNRGATVRAWTQEQILENFGIRAVLQGYAARLASQSTDEARLLRLEELQSDMESVISGHESGYIRDLAELSKEFHNVIVQMANSDVLESMIMTLTSVSSVERTFHGFESEDMQRSMMHHRDILRGIRAHDSEFTEAVMTSHFLAMRPAALAMFQKATPADSVDSAD